MRFLNKKIGALVFTLFFIVIGHSQNLVPGGVEAGAAVTLDCSSGPCVTLSADFHESRVTDERYDVYSIPMDPVVVNFSTRLNVDDAYSEIVDLDDNSADNFAFCFFGIPYEEIQIGDNGTITFNTIWNPFQTFQGDYILDGDIPTPQGPGTSNIGLPNNSVFGAFHDLLIPAGTDLVTYGVTGTAPFRAFVINYRNVPHFGCAGSLTTQQIVLHETSNFIDVYITEKPNDCSHEGGNAAIGIQNDDGSEGYSAPGRNTSDSPWGAIDEAWRFAPFETGAPTFTFEWINMTTGLVESTDPDYEVCPTETTTYQAYVTWISCVDADGDGNLDTEFATDEVTVTVDLPFTLVIDGGDQDFCIGDPAYTINTTTTVTGGVTITGYNWYEAADPSTSLGTGDSLSVSTTGTYVVEVTDSGGCVLTQQVNINYNPNPDAGTAVAISDICDTETALDLGTGLTGADTGGTWSDDDGSGGLTGNTFDATGLVGTYNFTYTVTLGTCPPDSETVQVTVIASPDAGIDGAIVFCSTDAITDLYGSLGGTPATGGTWSPALASGTGDFNPAVDTAGTYTYTVTGTTPCANATADVVVSVVTAPEAGTNGTIDFCSTDAITDLFGSLGGTPDAGGTWSPALASGTGNFNPAVDSAGVYIYTVVATGSCSVDATATVTVGLTVAPNAGTDGSIDFCTTDTTTDLFNSLGTADTGGTWSPALASGTGNFNPAVDAAGVYTYTVTASGFCSVDATATVTVGLTIAPEAGTDGTIDFCSTDATTDLFTSLGGTPDVGGTWSPALASGTGDFNPAVDTAGVYTYTVVATGFCSVDATATVTVGLTVAPNAGTGRFYRFLFNRCHNRFIWKFRRNSRFRRNLVTSTR